MILEDVFFWRMMLLLVFGLINTAFYQGDILTLYAFLGLLLIPVVNWSNKAVFITAVILMLQPLEWARCIYYILNPDYVSPPNLSNAYYESIGYYMKNGSFVDYVIRESDIRKNCFFIMVMGKWKVFSSSSFVHVWNVTR